MTSPIVLKPCWLWFRATSGGSRSIGTDAGIAVGSMKNARVYFTGGENEEQRRVLAEIAALPTISRAQLLAWSEKRKPPQSWYDEEDDLS